MEGHSPGTLLSQHPVGVSVRAVLRRLMPHSSMKSRGPGNRRARACPRWAVRSRWAKGRAIGPASSLFPPARVPGGSMQSRRRRPVCWLCRGYTSCPRTVRAGSSSPGCGRCWEGRVAADRAGADRLRNGVRVWGWRGCVWRKSGRRVFRARFLGLIRSRTAALGALLREALRWATFPNRHQEACRFARQRFE